MWTGTDTTQIIPVNRSYISLNPPVKKRQNFCTALARVGVVGAGSIEIETEYLWAFESLAGGFEECDTNEAS